MSTMETTLPFTDEKPLFKRLAELAEYSQLNDEQQREYDECLDDLICYNNSMAYKYKIGVKEGEQKGLQKGIQKGIQKGRQEERAKAHHEKLESAYILFKKNIMSLDDIASTLSLGLNELSDYIISKERGN